jgi:hypothetical protein
LGTVIVLCWCWAICASAFAQQAAPAPEAAPATTAPSAADSTQVSSALIQSASLTDDQKQEIDNDVAAIANEMASTTDPVIQTNDQKWFDKPMAAGTATQQFLDAYAKSVNDHLLALVKAPTSKFRAKLEAGMAAAQVAQDARDIQLLPTVAALMDDPSTAVALVGLKAAGNIMPYVLAQAPAQAQALLNEVVKTVQTHPDPPLGGAIVDEAYTGLLQPLVFGGGPVKAGPAQVEQFVVPTVFSLEKIRLDIYKNQIPANPFADTVGVVILLTPSVFTNANGGGLTPKEQIAALQMTSDLTSVLTQWAALVRGNQAMAGQSEPLIGAVREIGHAIDLFSDTNDGIAADPGINAAAQIMKNVGAGTGPNAIRSAGTGMTTATTQYVQHSLNGSIDAPPTIIPKK